MDASDDADSLELLSLSRGPNPYLDKERCLLCGCERQDPPEAAAYKIGKLNTSNSNFAVYPKLCLTNRMSDKKIIRTDRSYKILWLNI